MRAVTPRAYASRLPHLPPVGRLPGGGEPLARAPFDLRIL